MVIVKYSQFLAKESKTFENKKGLDLYQEEMSILENEYLRMKQEGLTEVEINENIFTSLFTSLGGGFGDTFKDYIVDWAAEKLGIIPKDFNGQPTFFYQVIRNVIESIHFTEIGSYFGKGSCRKWATAIVEGLAETLEERGIEFLLRSLGLRVDMNSGMGGTISSGLRETLTNYINDTAFMNKIEDIIGDKICNFKLGDVLKTTKFDPSDKQKMENQIEKAGEANPDIYTKLMRSGLSNALQFK